VLTLAQLDRLFHYLPAPLAHDVPTPRILRNLGPVERAREIDLVDGDFGVVRRSPFQPDAQPGNSRLQLSQLFLRIRLRLLLQVAQPRSFGVRCVACLYNSDAVTS